MNKIIFILIISLASSLVFSQSKKKGKIVYKYKKFQKFDFEDISIEGETGTPPDLGVDTRLQRKFRNKLPYRKSFNPEIRKGIERIR